LSSFSLPFSLYDYQVSGKRINLLLEFAAKGDFFRYFQKMGKLGEEEVAQVLYQMLLALKYLHDKDIIHRDIKLENILMDEDKVIKLCDFGWCSPPGDPNRHLLAGTYEYMAPEVVKREYYGTKIDIWSMGVLAFELLHRYTPFKGPNSAIISSNIIAGQFTIDYNVSPNFRDFIKACLAYNPDDRPTAQSLLEHQLFSNFRNIHFSRKSVRHSNLVNPHGKFSYMPDHSLMVNSNYFDPNMRKTMLENQKQLSPPGVNYSQLDNTLLQRLGADSNYGRDQGTLGSNMGNGEGGNQEVPPPYMTSSYLAQHPFDDPFSAPYSRQKVESNQQMEGDNGLRASYQAEYDVNFEDKPNFTLQNMNNYIEFDISPQDLINALSNGGRAVVGIFDDMITGIHELIKGFDTAEKKRDIPVRHERGPRKNTIFDNVDLTDRPPDLSSRVKQILPTEMNKPIKLFNVDGPIGGETQPSIHTQSSTRGPIALSYKNRPVVSPDDSPDIWVQETPKEVKEPSFFENVLDFFGFSSKNEDLKTQVKIQQARKEERRRETDERKKAVEADYLFENYKGSS
jgi:serine/threonine protein kinase